MLFWGHNPLNSGPDGETCFNVREALDTNPKIIVVDPRATELTGRAAVWLQLRPGTDDALALSFLNVIVDESSTTNPSSYSGRTASPSLCLMCVNSHRNGPKQSPGCQPRKSVLQRDYLRGRSPRCWNGVVPSSIHQNASKPCAPFLCYRHSPVISTYRADGYLACEDWVDFQVDRKSYP